MTSSHTAELHDLIDRVFTAELGGRATTQMVHDSVHRTLPDHLVDFLVAKGLRHQVTAYFREKDDDGLPKRPEVNDGGEHLQLDFATVTEHAYLHRKYMQRADQNIEQASKVRQRCLDKHGVDITDLGIAS
ncbi:hypothetical protein [Janibacter anophelis]|uniref:hypothetical protein n=1 Tax=Janibacter anophelis TaxID=319054 RepID=UPI000DEF5E52|nr:hypothetical protein [Janibacter anophelis]